jgi:hypothetical protein
MPILRPIPERVVPWSDKRLRGAWVVLGVAAIAALAFLPKTVLSGDEVFYAGQARTLLHGRLLPRGGDPIPARVGLYPPGWPAALALGAVFGFRGMFVVALAVHLAGAAAVARILVRRDLPAVGAAVYLFHPVFWNLSRTLMSDAPTTAMFVIAIDGWEQRRILQSAIGVFATLATRLAAVFALGGLALAVLPRVKARRRECAWLVATGILAVGVLLLANLVAYGDPLQSPYAANNGRHFDLHYILDNGPLYLAGALLIPPFPLALLLWRPRLCDRWVLAALPILAILSAYYFHDRSARPLEALVVGQRLVASAHAALIVGTAGVWGELRAFRSVPLIASGGAVAAVVQILMARHAYQKYEPALAAINGCAPSRIAYNWNAAKVALSADADEYFDIAKYDPFASDVLVFSDRSPTNQGIEMPLDSPVPPALRAANARCGRVGEFSIFFLSEKCTVPGYATPCNPEAGAP